MERVYIYGYTHHSMKVKAMLSNRYQFCGYIIDDDFYSEDMNDDVMAWSDFINTEKPSNCSVLVTLGYSKMNENRKNVIQKVRNAGYSVASFVHETAIICDNVQMGEGVIVLCGCIIEPNVSIGTGTIIDSGATICHDSVLGNYDWIGVSSVVLGNCKIGDNAFIGSNSTIKDGVYIAEKTLVGAGAFINKDTTAESVIVPVRSLKLERKSSEIKI